MKAKIAKFFKVMFEVRTFKNAIRLNLGGGKPKY